ncbi:MAG: ABC transporter ATP-binding protein [Maledivibacter sp.]|nr:ABC transporter ATP-binding protein [Maledivibacter sp.]
MTVYINGLEFSYAREKILKGINLNILPGEHVCILGPNGAGKSTLIKCMDGLLKPQKGDIRIDGRSIGDMKREEIAKKLGYVPQSSTNLFTLKVFDMVLLGRRPHTTWRSSENDKRKVLNALELLNIEHLAMKNFNEISGGQQQKVIIARAIAQETDILLLDEATSNLDIRHQLEVMDIIRRLVDELGISAVMIVHDLNIAARYSDKIIIMNEGEIAAYGTPEEVLTEENISSVYGVEICIGDIKEKPYVVPLKAKYA